MVDGDCFRRLGLVLVLMWLAATLVSACQPQGSSEADKKIKAAVPPAAIVKHYTKGPIKLEMRVDRGRINTAQFFHLTLRVAGPEDYAFELPAAAKRSLGDFTISGVNKSTPELNGANGVVQQQSYLLEPDGAGKFKLPVLKVSAWHKDKDQAPVIEIDTEELPLIVESLLPPGQDAHLADIAPPVAQPWNWLPWTAGGLGLAALFGLGWFLWRRRKPGEAPLPPPVPPYLAALQALDRLLARDLPAKGMVKEFYAAVSDILRQYIERHFGLRAPERTTEEFLAELGRLAPAPPPLAGSFNAGPAGWRLEHKRLLRDFLTHCDLVKFAEHQPSADDIESAVNLCRRFINETGAGYAEPEAAQDLTKPMGLKP